MTTLFGTRTPPPSMPTGLPDTQSGVNARSLKVMVKRLPLIVHENPMMLGGVMDCAALPPVVYGLRPFAVLLNS